MQIPPEKIQEILDRIDIVSIVSRHVELKRSGRSFKGLCPFHGEKTPSFYVFASDRGRFKCFGCDAGGDAISFVQRVSGQTFVDTVRTLARETGVSLEEREDPAAKERAKLYEANELARRFYEERLWSPAGQAGRAHLEARGVSEEIARRFHLGYAVNAWGELTNHLVQSGMIEWGAKAGLCAPRKSDGYYDSFRGRLMIPIRAAEGRTVAFGARLIEETPRADGEKGPKYLNSRETPVYRKSETLYALDLARDTIRQKKTAVLVEGYFDVIGLFTAGVTHAVALCSTALTSGHLAALTRAGAEEVVLLLDGDAAGQKAVERLAGPILASGTRAKVACLPAGDDPDTFAAREGKGGVERLLLEAAPLTVHLLQLALPKGNASAWEEKIAALSRLGPVVEQMPAGLEKTLFISEIARHLGVAESAIAGHLAPAQAQKAPAQPARASVERSPAPPPFEKRVNRPARPLETSEEWFAALLLSDASLRGCAEARFVDEIGSLEVRLMLSSEGAGDLGVLPEAVRRGLELRMAEVAPLSGEERRRALSDASRKVRLLRVAERIGEKRAELAEAEAEGIAPEELEPLQLVLKELYAEEKRLKARGPAAASVRSTR